MKMNKKAEVKKKPKPKSKPKVKAKVIDYKTMCMIDEVCADKGISVYAMAKSMNMHPNQVYAYTSNRALPNIITALLIAKTLDVTVEDLWIVTKK